MEKYGQYRDKGMVLEELLRGIALVLFNMLILPFQALELRLSFQFQMAEVTPHGSSRGGRYVYLFLSLGNRITRTITDISSVPLLPAVTFPDLLWFHLVRLGSMDDPWNSPPQSKPLVYYWNPWHLVG